MNHKYTRTLFSLFRSHFHNDAIFLAAACYSYIPGLLQPHYFQWYVYFFSYFGTCTSIHTFLDCLTQLVEQNVVPTCVDTLGKSLNFLNLVADLLLNSSDIRSTWTFVYFSSTRSILGSGLCPELQILPPHLAQCA
jgi:hypothetical protein